MSFETEVSEAFWASPEGVSLDATIKRLRRIEDAAHKVVALVRPPGIASDSPVLMLALGKLEAAFAELNTSRSEEAQ